MSTIRKVTEKEVMEILSPQGYEKLAKTVYEDLISTDAYKTSKDRYVYIISVFDLAETLGIKDKKILLHTEGYVEKIIVKGRNVADDFGFTRMVITDDMDFILDRYNEIKPEFNNSSVIVRKLPDKEDK